MSVEVEIKAPGIACNHNPYLLSLFSSPCLPCTHHLCLPHVFLSPSLSPIHPSFHLSMCPFVHPSFLQSPSLLQVWVRSRYKESVITWLSFRHHSQVCGVVRVSEFCGLLLHREQDVWPVVFWMGSTVSVAPLVPLYTPSLPSVTLSPQSMVLTFPPTQCSF